MEPGSSPSRVQEVARHRDFLERELQEKEQDYGPEHKQLVTILSDLGDVCGRLGDTVRSCDLLERSVYIMEREYSYGAASQAVPTALESLAEAYSDLGDADKKHELLERARLIKEFESSFQMLPVTSEEHSFSLSSNDLSTVPETLFSLTSVVTLNLSCNYLAMLPAQIGVLQALESLDVSRNKIFVLPPELGRLANLRQINAFANHLWPLKRSLPLVEFAALPKLCLLDLRFNDKIKEAMVASVLAERLPLVKVLLTDVAPKVPKMLTAGDRDATDLQSQLEPYSMYILRERLSHEFGVSTDTGVTRCDVMRQLLESYKARPRTVRKIKGVAPHSPHLLDLLLKELQRTEWPTEGRRERPKIRAEGYIILSRTGPHGSSTKAGRLSAAKVQRHSQVFELATQIMEEVDQDFASRWTAIAITNNFSGSPHIDHDNIGPFYGVAVGDFKGGGICVESGAFEVVEVDTHYALGKVDGRNPHWVAPYTGDRYSVVYYATWGEEVPRTTAVFEQPPIAQVTRDAPAHQVVVQASIACPCKKRKRS